MRIQYATVLRSRDLTPALERKAEGSNSGWPDEIEFQRDGRQLLLGSRGALHRWNAALLKGRLGEVARRTHASLFSRGPIISYGLNLGPTATFALLVTPLSSDTEGVTVLAIILSYDAFSVPAEEVAAAEERLKRSPFWFELGQLCAGLL